MPCTLILTKLEIIPTNPTNPTNPLLPIILADNCVPLRRHSCSAPPRLVSYVVSDCLSKAKEITGRLTRLTRKVQQERKKQERQNIWVDLFVLGQVPSRRSRSLLDLRTLDLQPVVWAEQLVTEMVDKAMEDLTKKKVRTCHQCHAPISDPAHNGVPYGVGTFPLEHWEGCRGGIKGGLDAKHKDWAPCPDMVESSDDSSDSTLSQTSLNAGDDDSDEIILKTTNLDLNDILGTDLPILKHKETVEPTLEKQRHPSTDCSDLESDDEAAMEELRLQREEVQKLQDQIQRETLAVAEAAKVEAAKLERKTRRQQKVALEKAELERQAGLLRAQMAGAGAAALPPHLRSSPNRAAGGTQVTEAAPVPPSSAGLGARNKDLSKQVAEHEARQQRRAANKLAKRQEQQQQFAGLSMAGIRSEPDLRVEVENYINRLKGLAPTLASDKTATGITAKTVQPAGLTKNGPSGRDKQVSSDTTKYVYVSELGKVVPVIDKLPGSSSDGVTAGRTRGAVKTAVFTNHLEVVEDDIDSDGECSPDEDCPIEPESGYRFSWKKYPDGNKYFIPVEVNNCLPEMEKNYVLDRTTGRYECRLVPVTKLGRHGVSSKSGKVTSAVTKSVNHSIQPQYKDHRVRSGSAVSRGRTQVGILAQKDERLPSYVHSDSEKEGKGLVPELVKYARECPVHWTSKITTQNMNVVLWSWAYIAQILASRTGQTPAMEDGELEARLQHFLSVLEVTLQTTGQSDFASDAWKIARLYHTKVQQKLDSGDTNWFYMYDQWGGSTLSHELMAANAEAAPAKRGQKQRGEDVGTGKGGLGKTKDDQQKRLCSSWNKCETRGKCEWEVENEGSKCKYAHHCSYCKYKKLNPVNHQRHFCKRRLEEEE